MYACGWLNSDRIVCFLMLFFSFLFSNIVLPVSRRQLLLKQNKRVHLPHLRSTTAPDPSKCSKVSVLETLPALERLYSKHTKPLDPIDTAKVNDSYPWSTIMQRMRHQQMVTNLSSFNVHNRQILAYVSGFIDFDRWKWLENIYKQVCVGVHVAALPRWLFDTWKFTVQSL